MSDSTHYKTEEDCKTGLARYRQRTGNTEVELPFKCRYCKSLKMNFEMVDGDGFLMCTECFDRSVGCLCGNSPGSKIG